MKSIAVIFNTNKLGGAERSMLLQLVSLQRNDLVFYLPKKDVGEVEKEIKRLHLGKVIYYFYPKSLYEVSRTNLFVSFFAFFEILKYLLFGHSFQDLKKFDVIYLNGNKAAFLFLLTFIFRKWKGRIIWHLRDYFYKSLAADVIWSTLLFNKNIKIICNSFSVKDDLSRSVLKKYSKTVIYNPSGLHLNARKLQRVETIGFVSMMAPWKGVHEMILFAWLYEKELIEMGIKKISIYGDNLYETQGEHRNYKEDLKKMINKFPSNLIHFEGMQSPEKIFSEIDCLVHHSLEKEPFGRVIIEGLDARIPVITTGLGGAGELIKHDSDGLIFTPYHRAELLQQLKKITTDQKIRESLLLNGELKAVKIQKDIDLTIASIVNEGIS